MLGFLLYRPAKLAARLILDRVFGKAEPFEYPITGDAHDPFVTPR